MDRETTKQMYGQVLQQIQAGDPMAAYSIFEQMPFPDQMAMFMTPGVGDAIAAVEAGVFNERSKENFAQGNVGRGLMDAGIGGLAAASTIPFVGKAAELGSMGVRGLRNLRSRMGDDMSGGGGGGIRTSQPEIDKLEAKKKELIKDYEVMTERMPESAARRYYPSDEIDEIDNQIYDLMSTSRGGGQTFKLKLAEKENIENMDVEELNSFIAKNDERLMDFTDEIGRGNKLDPSSEAFMKALENRNRIALNAKATKLYDPDFNPSGFDPDFPADRQGIAKQAEFVDDPMKPGSTADLEKQRMSRLTESEQTNIPKVREMIQKEKNLVAANNKEQIANRIQRELELEGGDMAPATRKRLESKLNTLMREIAELRGN
jgi:hypothetical protein